MDFTLTHEQEAIRKSAREYCVRELLPAAGSIEKEGKIPANIIAGLAEAGFFGLPFGKEYGGSGNGFSVASIALEEIARGSGAVAMLVGMNYLSGIPIDLFGTEEQKKKYLAPLCKGKAIGSFAFTEASTGSDPQAITTRATKDGDTVILNGTKRFITAADIDGPIVLSAFDGQAVSTYIGEKTMPGYSVIHQWDKLGMHGISLVDIKLENYRIPSENQLGEAGSGFKLLLNTIALGKLDTCAIILGCAQAALDEAIKYAKGRMIRGKPLSGSQNIQTLLAEIAVKVEAARWMTYRLASLADCDQDIKSEAALAKIFVTEAAIEIVNKAFRIHGAYAYVTDYRIERLLRDIYLGEIVEGSNEVQKVIVANSILKSAS
jgi:alkylation response protein AidB-like acyl-CoA dehydrogenase